jgi:hypothetical protein
MSCVDVATTGFPFDRVVLVAVCCLGLGTLLLLLARARRNGKAIGVVALLVVAVSAAVIAGAPAATAGPCPPGSAALSSLTIVQTSINIGLAPHKAPSAITGRIANHSSTAVYVGAVTVTIVAIVKAPRAGPGSCTAADYAVIAPRMRVEHELKSGQSLDFGGASIGFHSTALNQDACQGALVRLRFLGSAG